MRVLLSTIGSRGEVQPVAALAVRLRALGEEVRVCAPPDFRDWIDTLGIPFVPIGPELRGTGKAGPTAARPSPEQLRQMAEATVAAQFATVPAAAEGCDVLVAGVALQIAARSVAEQMGIPYVYAGYCPITLPSPHHAPPPCRCGDRRRRTVRPTIARSGLRTHSAGTTPSVPLSTRIGRRPAWRRSPTCGATSSPTGPGWPPTRCWRPGLIPRTGMSFRRAPGSCRTGAHCPRSWRRSLMPANRPSISDSAAYALRRTSAR